MLTKSFKNKELGRKGEAFAAQFYSARGAAIIGTNVTYRVGELDLIVREPDGTIVFVEVKTRSTPDYGVGEAVTRAKLGRMRKAASQWLSGRAKLADVRFDVLALVTNGAGFDIDYYQGV